MFNSYTKNTLDYNPKICINCGICSSVCPHGVFVPGEHAAVLAAPASCMECGACMRNCPVQAITVQSGVGCAEAMIRAAITGSKNETCGCGGEDEVSSCCCGGSKE
jgi:NAD-dependent dihydropyrimidine dehydrogenase PreA subunit